MNTRSRTATIRTKVVGALLLVCSFAAAGVALIATGGARAAVVAPSPLGARTYFVVGGDNLTALAARFDVTVPELRDGNHLSRSGRILVGQKLVVPPPRVVLPRVLRSSPSRLALRPSVRKWSKRNEIPADLLEATLYLESGWNQKRVSSTGAVGVGQLMPGTATFIERELIGRDLNPLNAEDNIRMSARYLRFLLRMHAGDSTKALQAYYQGVGSIRTNGLYTDTRQYAAAIQALRARFRADATGR